MRQVYLLICGVVCAVILVFVIFALNQANQEQIELTSRLQSRSQLLAESLAEVVEPALYVRATSSLNNIIDRFASKERLMGLGIFDNSGSVIGVSQGLPLPRESDFISDVMDRDDPLGFFSRANGVTIYVHVSPLHQEGRVVGALAVSQNATYIDESIRGIWWDNIVRLLLLIVILGGAIFVLARWIFFRSISSVVDSLQRARRTNSDVHLPASGGFLDPLVGEISKVTKSLRQARISASEEARMRLEKLDSPWTAERLKEFIKAHVKGRPIFVVSNSEPYTHSKEGGVLTWSVPAGGVITAIEPLLEACGGTWIARGVSAADKEVVDSESKIRVPPDEPTYTLKRVWVTPKELRGYYNGFSNEALWPLCHMAHVRPQFRKEDWTEYKKVNVAFAKALLEEVRHIERPLVLVQDYHLALVPALIKKSKPDAQVALFWHIPWPSADQFSICPWREDILEGMLGADLIGFHTQQHGNNFIETVASEIESRIDYEHFSIYRDSHRTFVKPFPVSIAYPGTAEPTNAADHSVLERLGIHSKYLLLGVDRLDYIKGIPERFRGVEFFLDMHPEYKGQVTLLQIGSPTRATVEKYQEYNNAVIAEADRINEKFGTSDWKPIVLERRNYSHAELRNLYQLASVCLVTSLHDGMNLVAKEYVAARADEAGALVLSQFTGASRDLKGAIAINPYSAEATADAIYEAVAMPKTEQHRRMRAMRASVSDYNTFRWSAELIKALSRLD